MSWDEILKFLIALVRRGSKTIFICQKNLYLLQEINQLRNKKILLVYWNCIFTASFNTGDEATSSNMETRLIHNSVVSYLMHTSRPIQSSIQDAAKVSVQEKQGNTIREIQFLCKILELFSLPRPPITRFSIFRVEISSNIVNNRLILIYDFRYTLYLYFLPFFQFHLASNCLRPTDNSTNNFLNNVSTAFPYIFRQH